MTFLLIKAFETELLNAKLFQPSDVNEQLVVFSVNANYMYSFQVDLCAES